MEFGSFIISISISVITLKFIYDGFKNHGFLGGFAVCYVVGVINSLISSPESFGIGTFIGGAIVGLIETSIYYLFFKHSNSFKGFFIKCFITTIIITLIIFGIIFYATMNMFYSIADSTSQPYIYSEENDKYADNQEIKEEIKSAVKLANEYIENNYFTIEENNEIIIADDIIRLINENYEYSNEYPISISNQKLPNRNKGESMEYTIEIQNINDSNDKDLLMKVTWSGQYYFVEVTE